MSHSLVFAKKVKPSRKAIITENYGKLLELESKKFNTKLNKYNKKLKEYKGKTKALLTANEAKIATKIVEAERMAYYADSLKFHGQAGKLDALKVEREEKTNKLLLKNLKNYKNIHKLRAEFNKNYASEFITIIDHLDDVMVNLGDLSVSLGGDIEYELFNPPFEFGEVSDRGGPDPHLISNDTFVDAQTGFLVNDFNYKHNGGGTFNPTLGYYTNASVGFSFTMPKTGIVRVDVVIQNTLSELSCSLTDDWGFSDGKVEMSQSLFLDILHPNNIQISETTMSTLTLTSDGDNVSAARNDLQTNQPYILNLQSSGAFAAGTVLQIMVGSKARVVSAVDDMTSNSNVLFAWQVKEVYVQVI